MILDKLKYIDIYGQNVGNYIFCSAGDNYRIFEVIEIKFDHITVKYVCNLNSKNEYYIENHCKKFIIRINSDSGFKNLPKDYNDSLRKFSVFN